MDGISCYFISLTGNLGFILTYTSALVLTVFNFAAVVYPHVFYKRDMLIPAGFATLASWIIGVLVAVLAVGFDIPTVAKCTPVSLMPRYGILTLVVTCLLCTFIVVVLNVKLVRYFRMFRIHPDLSRGKNITEPQRGTSSHLNDPEDPRNDSKSKQGSLRLTPKTNDQENSTALTSCRNQTATREPNRASRCSNEAVSDEKSTENCRRETMDIFVVNVKCQATRPLSDSACNAFLRINGPSTSSDSDDKPLPSTGSQKSPKRMKIDNHCTVRSHIEVNESPCLPEIQHTAQPFRKNESPCLQQNLDLTTPFMNEESLFLPRNYDRAQRLIKNESPCLPEDHGTAQLSNKNENIRTSEPQDSFQSQQENVTNGSIENQVPVRPMSADSYACLPQPEDTAQKPANPAQQRPTKSVRDKTIMMTLVILTFYTCFMNLFFTLYLLWSATLNTFEAKTELVKSLKGKIAVMLIVLNAALNPYFYLFRLINLNDIKRVMERVKTRCALCQR
ncbi:hypothetical protein ElyMa_001239400 [Elysia marginata]|uniref:G-protein coupled receptors family 1 profile domain-containing protein n=1 Tax=Elysia marginata TaxID=1093978 RepID=A0AAV4IAE5_9GAST|nr:hypothetical protein ElyMa_001239400 [Elysia marginata]